MYIKYVSDSDFSGSGPDLQKWPEKQSSSPALNHQNVYFIVSEKS